MIIDFYVFYFILLITTIHFILLSLFKEKEIDNLNDYIIIQCIYYGGWGIRSAIKQYN